MTQWVASITADRKWQPALEWDGGVLDLPITFETADECHDFIETYLWDLPED